MPILAGQLQSGRFRDGLVSDKDYKVNEMLPSALRSDALSKEIIYHTIHAVKGMLNRARIPIGHDFAVELSHHYGLEHFHEFGCVLVECITREQYSKKLIVVLPAKEIRSTITQKKTRPFRFSR